MELKIRRPGYVNKFDVIQGPGSSTTVDDDDQNEDEGSMGAS